MAAVTLSQLITRIRQRSDNEHSGSSFVTDAEITQLVNTSYGELYGHLLRASLNTAEALQVITADGSDNYNLPADYYSLISIYCVNGNYRRRLERYSSRHRPGATPSGDASSYRIVNTGVEFYPRPSGGTYEVVYIPVPGTLTDLTDTVDGVLGWEEYIVIDVTIHLLDKEESDSRMHRADRDRILERITDDAAVAEMNESWVVESGRSADNLMDLADITGYRGVRGPIRGRY